MATFASPSATATSLLPAFNMGGAADSPSTGRNSRDSPHHQSARESYSPPTPAPLPPPPHHHYQLNGDGRHQQQQHLGASGSSSDDDEEGHRIAVEDGDLEHDQLHLGAAASNDNKGKQVMRGEAGSLSVSKEEQDRLEEQERQKIIDKVLRRAQIAKTTRNFMNRLALASFKAQRGWQDVALDVIEPHLEQEAARRKQQQEAAGDMYQQEQTYQHPPPPIYGGLPHHMQSPQGLMGPPPLATNGVKRPRGGSMAAPGSMMSSPAPQGYDQQFQHDQPYASSPFPPHHHHPVASTSSLPSSDSRPQKRRHTNDPSSSHHAQPSYQSSPPAPRPPPTNGPQAPNTLPRSTANGRQQRPNGPLSSDPTFSSFVDAATALTGLSRASSDRSVNSGEDGSQEGAGDRRTSNGETAPGEQRRPSTPEGKRKDFAAALGAGAPGAESSAEGAAELMLFLAASPSPVQVRTGASRPALSEGMGMKGRRLFSNSGGAPSGDDFSAPPTQSNSVQAVFGEHLSPRPPAQVTLGASPSLFPSAETSNGNGDSSNEPSKSSSQYISSASTSSLAAPSSLGNGLPSSLPQAPGTPVRDRQPSGSNWESYLNVSPSPQRAPVDREKMEKEREQQGPRPVFGLQM